MPKAHLDTVYNGHETVRPQVVEQSSLGKTRKKSIKKASSLPILGHSESTVSIMRDRTRRNLPIDRKVRVNLCMSLRARAFWWKRGKPKKSNCNEGLVSRRGRGEGRGRKRRAFTKITQDVDACSPAPLMKIREDDMDDCKKILTSNSSSVSMPQLSTETGTQLTSCGHSDTNKVGSIKLGWSSSTSDSEDEAFNINGPEFAGGESSDSEDEDFDTLMRAYAHQKHDHSKCTQAATEFLAWDTDLDEISAAFWDAKKHN